MTTATLLDALHQQADEFIGLRRDIHHHPELAFDEHRTSELVASKLKEWGYEVERGLGGTGVVGRLQRGNARSRSDAIPAACDRLRASSRRNSIRDTPPRPGCRIQPRARAGRLLRHVGRTALSGR